MRGGHEVYVGDEMAIYVDGVFAGYVDRFQLRIDFDIKKIKLPRWKLTQHKVAGGEASGTMGGFLYSNYLQQAALSYLDDGPTKTISVVGSMRNQDTGESGTVAASGIVFQNADLANWEVGAEIKLEQSFFCRSVSMKGFKAPNA